MISPPDPVRVFRASEAFDLSRDDIVDIQRQAIESDARRSRRHAEIWGLSEKGGWFRNHQLVASVKNTKNYEKSPCLLCKSTMRWHNMAIFNSYMLNHQLVAVDNC